jgi:hypothetical protein
MSTSRQIDLEELLQIENRLEDLLASWQFSQGAKLHL